MKFVIVDSLGPASWVQLSDGTVIVSRTALLDQGQNILDRISSAALDL